MKERSKQTDGFPAESPRLTAHERARGLGILERFSRTSGVKSTDSNRFNLQHQFLDDRKPSTCFGSCRCPQHLNHIWRRGRSGPCPAQSAQLKPGHALRSIYGRYGRHEPTDRILPDRLKPKDSFKKAQTANLSNFLLQKDGSVKNSISPLPNLSLPCLVLSFYW